MDDKAFEQQILTLEPKLYRTAYALLWNDADAADVMQDCIIKAWRRLDSLRDDERFSAWVMRILINECRSLQRKNKHRTISFDEAIGDKEPTVDEPVDLGLRQALNELSPKLRLPLILHHMDGYSLDEIADMLHLPISTLKGRLYEARKKLRILIEREGNC